MLKFVGMEKKKDLACVARDKIEDEGEHIFCKFRYVLVHLSHYRYTFNMIFEDFFRL